MDPQREVARVFLDEVRQALHCDKVTYKNFLTCMQRFHLEQVDVDETIALVRALFHQFPVLADRFQRLVSSNTAAVDAGLAAAVRSPSVQHSSTSSSSSPSSSSPSSIRRHPRLKVEAEGRSSLLKDQRNVASGVGVSQSASSPAQAGNGAGFVSECVRPKPSSKQSSQNPPSQVGRKRRRSVSPIGGDGDVGAVTYAGGGLGNHVFSLDVAASRPFAEAWLASRQGQLPVVPDEVKLEFVPPAMTMLADAVVDRDLANQFGTGVVDRFDVPAELVLAPVVETHGPGAGDAPQPVDALDEPTSRTDDALIAEVTLIRRMLAARHELRALRALDRSRHQTRAYLSFVREARKQQQEQHRDKGAYDDAPLFPRWTSSAVMRVASLPVQNANHVLRPLHPAGSAVVAPRITTSPRSAVVPRTAALKLPVLTPPIVADADGGIPGGGTAGAMPPTAGHRPSHPPVLDGACCSSQPAQTRSTSGGASTHETPALLIPLILPLPRSTAWNPIVDNFRVEDDPVLRYVPYFGENDPQPLDVSFFERVPDDKEPEIRGDVDEATVQVMHLRYGLTPAVAASLGKVLQVSTSQVLCAGRNAPNYYPSTSATGPSSLAVTGSCCAACDAPFLRALQTRCPEARPSAHILGPGDESRRRAAVVSEATGLRPCGTYNELAESYRELFCRRCYTYDCRRHGLSQPQPRHRTDPPNSPAPPKAPAVPPLNSSERSALPPGTLDEPDQLTRCLLQKCGLVFGCTTSEAADVAAVLGTHVVPNVVTVQQLLAATGAQDQLQRPAPPPPGTNAKRVRSGRRKTHKWRNGGSKAVTISAMPHEFEACDHDGPCAANTNCCCFLNQTYCEKYCGCAASCERRFKGCRCRRGGCQSAVCPCIAAGRECDPDLCTTCGADDHTDPDASLDVPRASCCNASLKKYQNKRVSVGRSSIHGWGAFLRTSAEKNEFLCEYTGELVSQEEADRRGKHYDKIKCSFLFNLNEEFVVDATRKGAKVKFANHSSDPNCVAKIKLVTGDYKIGIYAKRDVKEGEELSFDYQHSYWAAVAESAAH